MLLLPLYLLLARSGSCTCRPASTFPWTAPQAQTQVHALIQDPATRGDRALHWYESTSDELLWNVCFWNEACSSGGKQVRQEKKTLLLWDFQVNGTTACRERQAYVPGCYYPPPKAKCHLSLQALRWEWTLLCLLWRSTFWCWETKECHTRLGVSVLILSTHPLYSLPAEGLQLLALLQELNPFLIL